MGRATQGVRLINLAKKNDVIASVCKVMSSQEEDVEEAEVLNEELPENSDNLENSETTEAPENNNE
jgi:DNA gyrase subunit A